VGLPQDYPVGVVMIIQGFTFRFSATVSVKIDVENKNLIKMLFHLLIRVYTEWAQKLGTNLRVSTKRNLNFKVLDFFLRCVAS
jgi:hypothetical protein